MSLSLFKAQNILILICTMLFILSGCEYIKPTQVWNPDEKGAETPVILSVEPDSAYDGILEIALNGENFSPVVGENFVHFGTEPGLVKTASTTQLTVIRPISASGFLTIQVAVAGAFLTGAYHPYKLEEGVVEIGGMGRVNSIAIDQNENLYAERDRIVYKLTPQGEQIVFGTTDFKSSAMRIGADGFLYIQKIDNRDLYRIAPEGGLAEKFVKLTKRASFFDFGESGYIYSGSEVYGLLVTDPTGTESTQIDEYDDLTVKAVRVFKGEVYVAADTSIENLSLGKGIWRHKILENGALEEKVLVLDWATSDNFAESSILDLTFSTDGDLYVGTNHSNPIFVLRSDGSLTTLYEGLVASPATQLYWGNGNYLYINRYGRSDDDSGIYRLVMGKKGAPYF